MYVAGLYVGPNNWNYGKEAKRNNCSRVMHASMMEVGRQTKVARGRSVHLSAVNDLRLKVVINFAAVLPV